MSKWRKVTIGVWIGMFVAAIAYDIVVVINSPKDTESNVMMTALYNFPFLAFALGVLVGHFVSPIRVKYGRWPALSYGVAISCVVLTVSCILCLGVKIPVGPITATMHAVSGAVVGALCWSQRRAS
jgi:MFS family permease